MWYISIFNSYWFNKVFLFSCFERKRAMLNHLLTYLSVENDLKLSFNTQFFLNIQMYVIYSINIILFSFTLYFFTLYHLHYIFFIYINKINVLLLNMCQQENEADKEYLQYCTVCEGFKAPRSHHCRKCKHYLIFICYMRFNQHNETVCFHSMVDIGFIMKSHCQPLYRGHPHLARGCS